MSIYNVNAGVTSDNLILNDGDQLFVHSDGIANETFVNADAFAFISKGGTINDTYINQDGEVDLETSATANNTKINTGGYMIVYEKAKANGTLVDGGSLVVSSNGIASDTTVNGPGYLYVFGSGKIAGSTTVNEGGNITLEWGVRSNVDVHGGKMVLKGDTEEMNPSELKTFTVDSGGSLLVSANGLASSGTITNASAKVLNGGTLEKVTLNAATVEVRNGALLSNADMKAGTVVDVQEGGAIRKLYVSTGAVLTGVLGEVSELQFDGGTLDLNIANMAPGGTVRVGGEAFTYISARPYECTLTVASGQTTGTYSLIEGATGFDQTITVKNTSGTELGTLSVGGALVSGALSYTLGLDTAGLYVTVGTGNIFTGDVTGETREITGDWTALSVNVNKDGILKVYEGGVARNTAVHESGTVTVSKGGFAYDTDVDGYLGAVNVSSGGSASGVTLGEQGYLRLFPNAAAEDVKVHAGGVLYAYNSATVTGIVADEGAWLSLTVGSNAYAKGTYAGTAFELKETADGFTVHGALNVAKGGIAKNTVVTGNNYLYVSSTGLASQTAVNPGGHMKVYSGGTAKVTDVTGGEFIAQDNGSADVVNVGYLAEAKVSAGGIVTNVTVDSGGDLRVSAGGKADVVTANFGGDLYVSAGGSATKIKENGGYVNVNPGATADFLPNSFGGYSYNNGEDWATLHSGTTGTDLTAANKGGINIYNGGIARNVTIGYLGNLQLAVGGKVTGKMTFEAGADIYAETGAILDFDLTQTTAGADALVNDLSFAMATDFSYTLTVDGTEAAGDYKLAENATGFDKTITVVNTSGDTLDTITISDGTKTIDGRDYTLTLSTGGLLGVTVGGGATPDLTGDLTSSYNLETGRYASSVNIIDPDGRLRVENGARAIQTTINSHGSMTVSAGGSADLTTVNSHGWLEIQNGATVTNVKENGGYVNDYLATGVTYVPNSFGGMVFDGNDWVSLHSGTTATNLTIGKATIYIFGGKADGIAVKADGQLLAISGKLTGKITFETGAEVNAYDGAILDFDLTQTAPGADALVNDLSFAISLPFSYTLTVAGTEAAGDYKLAEGATGFDKTITVVNTSGTTLGTISVGATATLADGRDYTLTLSTGGLLGVTVGGGATPDLTGDLNTYYDLGTGKYASAVNILENGELDVEKGALASQTTVTSGGYFYLYEGGVAKETAVNSGGRFYNYEGEADAVTVNYGGYLCVSSGKATQVTESGGCVEEYDGAVVEYVPHGITGLEVKDWNSATLHSGTTATDTTIGYGGYLLVYNGGSAGNTDVAAYGSLDVYEGGKATGVTVADGGGLYVYAGGSATGIDVASGAFFELTVAPGTYVKGTYGGSAVETGNTVADYTVHSGCAVDVENGGLATDTTVEEGGWVYVENGGKAEGVTVASGGQIDIYVGGSATGIVAADGARLGLSIAPNTYAKGTLGGKAFEASDTLSDFTVHTGSWLEVFNGGSVDNITVDHGGSFWINDYGTATNVMENGGYVYVDNYADVKFVANTFTGLEVKGGKVATVHSGTTATDTKLSGYGNLDVYEGGLAINTVLNSAGYLNVSSGGLASATIVNNDGGLYAYGGTASDTTVKKDGNLYVYEDGAAEDVTVEEGGYLYVNSGGKLTGKAAFETGAFTDFDDGAIIDFDLRKTTTADPALVNDLSVVGTAAVKYTLTVDGTQASGTYNLADGATGFDKTITVMSPYGDEYGSLAVGGTLSTAFADYTLNLSDGALTLDLAAKAVTDTTKPVVTNVQLSTIEFTNQNVTVTADFTDNVAVKSKLYKIDDGAWQDYDPVTGVVVTENATVYFKAIDTSDNESDVVPCNVSIIDKVPPTITITPSTTESGAESVTLSAVCEDETCMSSILQYRIGDGAWQDCTEPVTVTENTTVSFKTFDAAGNETVESYAVTNITAGGTVITGDLAAETKEIDAGMVASDVNVNENGMLNVNDGGVASQTTVNAEGGLYVYNGGSASQTSVNAGGELFLYDGGKADGTTVDGGAVYIENGGSATDTTLQNNGSLIVSNGGVAAGATAEADGWIRVSAGGVVEDVEVKNGGKFLVSAGGKATGRMTFETGAYINFYDGAILDFNIYSLSPGNEALMNDLSLISGTPKYTLTVNGAQALGTYNLASGAMGFDQAITVQSILGTEVGTLTVDGGATKIGDVFYTLLQTGSDLMVTVSEGSVSDTTPPTISIYPSTTEPAASVTVSAVILDDEGVKTQQYRIGDGEWKNYTAPVTVTENVYISFRATDTSGNETIQGYNVTNIQSAGPSPVSGNEPANNMLFKKNKKKYEWNSDENIAAFYENNVVAGDSMVYLDKKGSVESDDGKFFNSLSRTKVGEETVEDAADYAKIELAHGAALTFSVDSTVGGTFYVYEKTKDKNGNDVATQRQKITVKANKTSPAKLTTIYLKAGEYYVGMEGSLPSAKKKPEFTAYYNVNLTGTKYFENADDGWNDSVYALGTDGKEDKTKFNAQLEAGALSLERGVTDIKLDDGAVGTNDWVGFSDAADYRMFTLSGKTNLTLSLSVSSTATGKGKAKLTIWKVSTSAKTGKITLSSKGSVEVKQGATGFIKSKVLSAGTYFVSVSSSSASKGGDVSCSVKVDEKTVFFDSADNSFNNVLYNKKGKAFYGEDETHHFETTAVNGTGVAVKLDTESAKADGYDNFVGYQDKADYAKIMLASDGNLSFDLKATGGATFVVYRKGQDKKGNDTLEAIQTTKLTLAKGASVVEKTTELLTGLEAGEYYISMTASDTSTTSKGSVFYNVTASLAPSLGDALAMPETSDALAMTDSLNFGGYDADALADASASTFADLDDKSGWMNIASLA